MNLGILTLVLFGVTILAWVALQMFYVLNGMPTISQQIWSLYAAWPPLGFLVGLVVGVLLGHWFFGR